MVLLKQLQETSIETDCSERAVRVGVEVAGGMAGTWPQQGPDGRWQGPGWGEVGRSPQSEFQKQD